MAPFADLEYFRLPPRWLFVKITDTEGNVGWGEATLEGHTLSVEGALDQYKHHLLHSSPHPNAPFDCDQISLIHQSLHTQSFYRGGPTLQSALSGIDIALWDLKARRLNVPIHSLLGGRVRDKVRVYSWIGGDTQRANTTNDNGSYLTLLANQAAVRRTQGFRAVKLIPTGDIAHLDSPTALAHVVSRVRTVKNAGLDCALDFHGRLHAPMARQLVKILEREGVLFIEEPLLSEYPAQIAQLHAQTSVPIALGERTYSCVDALRFLSPGGSAGAAGPAIDILQPDVAHCGGITELVKLASLASSFDVAIAPHCPLGPLALAACVAVDLVATGFGWQEMGVGIHYNTEKTFEAGGEKEQEGTAAEEKTYDITSYIRNPEVWTIREGGYIDAPMGPGLGVEVDEEEVRRVSKAYTEQGLWWTGPRFYGEVDREVREW